MFFLLEHFETKEGSHAPRALRVRVCVGVWPLGSLVLASAGCRWAVHQHHRGARRVRQQRLHSTQPALSSLCALRQMLMLGRTNLARGVPPVPSACISHLDWKKDSGSLSVGAERPPAIITCHS
jgi:hypothetical protein